MSVTVTSELTTVDMFCFFTVAVRAVVGVWLCAWAGRRGILFGFKHSNRRG